MHTPYYDVHCTVYTFVKKTVNCGAVDSTAPQFTVLRSIICYFLLYTNCTKTKKFGCMDRGDQTLIFVLKRFKID